MVNPMEERLATCVSTIHERPYTEAFFINLALEVWWQLVSIKGASRFWAAFSESIRMA